MFWSRHGPGVHGSGMGHRKWIDQRGEDTATLQGVAAFSKKPTATKSVPPSEKNIRKYKKYKNTTTMYTHYIDGLFQKQGKCKCDMNSLNE